MLYIHMHLYLLKLWKALAEVPLNGTRPAGEGITPWIVSDMALAQRDDAAHAYPLRELARWVAILWIFAAGPLVLAAFWWRSMPKHDEALTVLACGVPLFASLLAGWESWRALRRGGAEERHMRWRTRAGWGAGLVGLSVIGFLTTQGGITDGFLRPAQLQGVVFVETPPDWLPRDEAEQAFRQTWCADHGIPPLACGPGSLAQISVPLAPRYKISQLPYLAHQRQDWCDKVIPDYTSAPDCASHFAELERQYRTDWRKARRVAIAALPERDLSGADLRYADLAGARMTGASLRDARMEGADLRKVRMEGADLTWAKLDRVIFYEAHMAGADLRWARLNGAAFYRAGMSWADFSRAQMKGANLKSARMVGSDLSSAQMQGSDLSMAQMEGADLSMAQMEGANLLGVRIKWANLSNSDLKGADLDGARMEGADLSMARMDSLTRLGQASLIGVAFRGRDYSDLSISEEHVNLAFGDASSILPKGIDRPAHWPDWDLGRDFRTQWRRWRNDTEGYVPPPAPDE